MIVRRTARITRRETLGRYGAELDGTFTWHVWTRTCLAGRRRKLVTAANLARLAARGAGATVAHRHRKRRVRCQGTAGVARWAAGRRVAELEADGQPVGHRHQKRGILLFASVQAALYASVQRLAESAGILPAAARGSRGRERPHAEGIERGATEARTRQRLRRHIPEPGRQFGPTKGQACSLTRTCRVQTGQALRGVRIMASASSTPRFTARWPSPTP